MDYTAESVDGLLNSFEKTAAKQCASKNSAVKLRAVERDLLTIAEQIRDLMKLAVKSTSAESRDLLKSVFGDQGCNRFFRFRAVLETVEFSEMHATDQRWGHLKDVIEIIEEILKQLGMFKPKAKPPINLEYPTVKKAIFTGEELCFESSIEGGAIAEWTIEPALPQGLELDQETGAIKGTPMEPAADQDYTITATNSGGDVSAKVSFGIKMAPPVAISYPDAASVYPMGGVIRLEPEVELQSGEMFEAPAEAGRPSLGRLSSRASFASQASTFKWEEVPKMPSIRMPKMKFAIEPALPDGLKLMPVTGVISGKPKNPHPETIYTVTVSNDSGSVSVELPLAIKLIPPSELYYQVPVVLYTDDPVNFAPAVDGLVDHWSVEPALPEGLKLDNKMGSICGAPKNPTSGSWVITAKNSEGETSTTVKFEVIDEEPTELRYPKLEVLYPALRKMNACATVEGRVKEFSVEPALPSGLSLNPKTGEISGVPGEPVAEAEYVVSAKNDTGACTATLRFEVRMMPPAELGYSRLDDLYEVGETVDLEPEVEGGADSWTVEPALPAALTLDAATGRISGTLTETAEEASYTVTASNDAGGTSTVLTFSVTAPPPAGLTYPEAHSDYIVGGESVMLEPVMEQGVCCTFSVSPTLPGGLELDLATGVISGSPTEAAEPTIYTITATNIAGTACVDLEFSCSEIVEDEVSEDYASQIEAITDLAQLATHTPDKKATTSDWMIWMVHRAYLNDPTLTDFNFNNMLMPLPHLEPRVAPKLMKALETNTKITSLQLMNSNLQKPSGQELALALRHNKTLALVNIESNNCDSESIRQIAVALKENEESALETFKFNNQQHLGEYFGRPVEAAVAELMETNTTITKLGFSCNDPHWRDVIDRRIMSNVDAARRKRKRKTEKGLVLVAAEDKTLSRVVLLEPPDTDVSEIFEADNEQFILARALTAKSKRLPTKEQLQANAKAAGKPLKYSDVAPLVRDFRKRLFDAALHNEVQAVDAYNVEESGTMHGWEEKNDNFDLDIWPGAERRLRFKSTSRPIVEISEDFAAWLAPDAA